MTHRSTQSERIQARISREQYEHASQLYDPLIDELLSVVDDPDFGQRQTQRARENTQRGFGVAEAVAGRQRERFGVARRPDARASDERTTALAQAAATAGAVNTTREATADQVEAARRGAIGIGLNLAGMAQDTAATTAGLASQRRRFNTQMDAQEDARTWQALATLGTLGVMLSTAEAKEAIEPADEAALAAALREIDVVRFRYRPELHIPGEFVGAVVEQVPAIFRGPDGRTLNGYNVLGALIAALHEKDRELAALGERLARLEAQQGGTRDG